jgi:hypothetical protein
MNFTWGEKMDAQTKETLMLETAAQMYDVVLSTLRNQCKAGVVKAVKVGKRWYVERREMERVFKGISAREANAIRSSRKPTRRI